MIEMLAMVTRKAEEAWAYTGYVVIGCFWSMLRDTTS